MEELKSIAKRVRINIINMLANAGSGHPGGSLSCVEILVCLFCYKFKRTKENALDPDRDKFVLSKGHAVPTLYAILAEIGVIPKEELYTLRKLGSRLQGHPSVIHLPYVEASTGSLGQGLAIAQGMAIASKLDNKKNRIYCLVGDGEIQEGEVWETFMSAPKFKLNNLYVFLDNNKFQLDSSIEAGMPIEPIKEKLKAFNWHVLEIIDGHNFTQIIDALNEAEKIKDKPIFIICHTIKGKGVSFMENNNEWHGVAPNKQEAELALKELYEKSD